MHIRTTTSQPTWHWFMITVSEGEMVHFAWSFSWDPRGRQMQTKWRLMCWGKLFVVIFRCERKKEKKLNQMAKLVEMRLVFDSSGRTGGDRCIYVPQLQRKCQLAVADVSQHTFVWWYSSATGYFIPRLPPNWKRWVSVTKGTVSISCQHTRNPNNVDEKPKHAYKTQ